MMTQKGFEFVAVGTVVLGISFVIQDFFDETIVYKAIEQKIPTSDPWKEKVMRWLISDFIESTALIIYIAFKF